MALFQYRSKVPWHNSLERLHVTLMSPPAKPTWWSLAVLKNLAKSFRKGTRWTRQITGSVDLSEMDCIARRHTHDFRPVSPCKNGDWLRVSRCLSPFWQRALNHAPGLPLCQEGTAPGAALTE